MVEKDEISGYDRSTSFLWRVKMTKQKYYQKINALDYESANFNSGFRLAVPMVDAEMIAEEADAEIEKLKELLKEVLTVLETRVGCPLDLVKRVDEALE
jgi:hypothetical protein